MLDFSFDTDAKEVAAGIEIGEKMLRYCIINSMKMERMKRKNQGDSGSCGKWSYLHRIEKRISRYFGERQQKTVLKHVGRYCEIADLKYENLSNVRQEKRGKLFTRYPFICQKPLKTDMESRCRIMIIIIAMIWKQSRRRR